MNDFRFCTTFKTLPKVLSLCDDTGRSPESKPTERQSERAVP